MAFRYGNNLDIAEQMISARVDAEIAAVEGVFAASDITAAARCYARLFE